MFDCDAPLGMENGNINDDQITAKVRSPSTTGPLKSRLRSNDAWCPQAKDDYLQIDLGSIYKIKNIAVQGLATSYCIQYGKDGKTYKPYGLRASTCEELSSDASTEPHFLKKLRPFIARHIRIRPTQGSNKCVRLEFYGCLSENLVFGGYRTTPWEKIPSSAYQIQINHIQISWNDARSYCLEQKADLLSMSTATIAEYIKTRLTRLRPFSWWIGLTDRDYPTTYYWTDTSPVNYIGWAAYSAYSMFLNFYNR
ncbi:discoidin domain-containing receptor 2-like isoform X1 [Paramuricea clavata]|nr:discoidin domain-containing receptor 2-like isoform X1 [Paramuricea clavata]